MKTLKRTFLIILILLTIGILLRGTLYRNIVAYESIGQRMNYEITNDKLTQYIKENCREKDNADIKEIIKTGLSLTSKILNFTFSKNDCNPNKLIDLQTANCVGYAAFFSTVCNYQLKRHNLSEEWIAQPEIGQIYVFGVNIHRYFNFLFFKDHDFVIIKNKKTKETYAVDPSIYDYLYISFVTLKNNSQ
ncbi:MAG: hypothetical protein FWF52_01840 [Candidatus Azobacteroides sp.]|nr:hypothetical protein [Candidatus Azobacteroides sp.]